MVKAPLFWLSNMKSEEEVPSFLNVHEFRHFFVLFGFFIIKVNLTEKFQLKGNEEKNKIVCTSGRQKAKSWKPNDSIQCQINNNDDPKS